MRSSTLLGCTLEAEWLHLNLLIKSSTIPFEAKLCFTLNDNTVVYEYRKAKQALVLLEREKQDMKHRLQLAAQIKQRLENQSIIKNDIL